MKNSIKIGNQTYEVLDALNNITMADSFVKNKLGGGHGEAKLYVGNEGQRYNEFFDDLSRECFFIKKDFDKYLYDAKEEFYSPQQEYLKKDQMNSIYDRLLTKLTSYQESVLKFNIQRVDVAPPRVYLKSDSEYYDLMRALGLPNISYVSILKIKSKQGNIFYYFKLFIDYKSDIVKYDSPLVVKEEEKIKNDLLLTDKKKEILIRARQGQGEYRRKLIEDCQYCPFTLVNDERLLIASHIKPWVVSDDREKVDYKNGFALTPTFDKLFDQGFITFEDDKILVVSPWISPMNQNRLNIYNGMKVPKLQLDNERCNYLKYHREKVYKG